MTEDADWISTRDAGELLRLAHPTANVAFEIREGARLGQYRTRAKVAELKRSGQPKATKSDYEAPPEIWAAKWGEACAFDYRVGRFSGRCYLQDGRGSLEFTLSRIAVERFAFNNYHGLGTRAGVVIEDADGTGPVSANRVRKAPIKADLDSWADRHVQENIGEVDVAFLESYWPDSKLRPNRDAVRDALRRAKERAGMPTRPGRRPGQQRNKWRKTGNLRFI